jgi:hypothetical protein
MITGIPALIKEIPPDVRDTLQRIAEKEVGPKQLSELVNLFQYWKPVPPLRERQRLAAGRTSQPA